jgi:hypothetical protein
MQASWKYVIIQDFLQDSGNPRKSVVRKAVAGLSVVCGLWFVPNSPVNKTKFPNMYGVVLLINNSSYNKTHNAFIA